MRIYQRKSQATIKNGDLIQSISIVIAEYAAAADYDADDDDDDDLKSSWYLVTEEQYTFVEMANESKLLHRIFVLSEVKCIRHLIWIDAACNMKRIRSPFLKLSLTHV